MDLTTSIVIINKHRFLAAAFFLLGLTMCQDDSRVATGSKRDRVINERVAPRITRSSSATSGEEGSNAGSVGNGDIDASTGDSGDDSGDDSGNGAAADENKPKSRYASQNAIRYNEDGSIMLNDGAEALAKARAGLGDGSTDSLKQFEGGFPYIPGRSRAKRSSASADYDSAVNRISNGNYTQDVSKQELDSGEGATRDYLLYFLKVVEDLKFEKNRIVLTKDKLASQEFLKIANTIVDTINADSDIGLDTIEPDFFLDQMSRLSFTQVKLGFMAPKPEVLDSNDPSLPKVLEAGLAGPLARPGLTVTKKTLPGGKVAVDIVCDRGTPDQVCDDAFGTLYSMDFKSLSKPGKGDDFRGYILEIYTPYTQEVQIDKEGSMLEVDAEYGIARVEVHNSIIRPYGMRLKSKDISGPIQHVVLAPDGQAILFIKTAEGKTEPFLMLNESFFYYFTWFAYKFEMFNSSTKPWLETSLAQHPIVPIVKTLTVARYTLNNEANQVMYYRMILKYLMSTGSRIIFRPDWLMNSSFPDYKNFYDDVIDPSLTSFGAKSYITKINDITFTGGNIAVRMKEEIPIKQGKAKLVIPTSFSLHATGKDTKFGVSGVKGTMKTSFFGKKAKLKVKDIRINEGSNRISIKVKGKIKIGPFTKTKTKTEHFNLGSPLE